MAASISFSYTGYTQYWTVPSGWHQVIFQGRGGSGNKGSGSGYSYGPGEESVERWGTNELVAGDSLAIIVGGSASGVYGGFGGGGKAGTSAGGGGGGTAVFRAPFGACDLLFCAGGGGGGGSAGGGGGTTYQIRGGGNASGLGPYYRRGSDWRGDGHDNVGPGGAGGEDGQRPDDYLANGYGGSGGGGGTGSGTDGKAPVGAHNGIAGDGGGSGGVLTGPSWPGGISSGGGGGGGAGQGYDPGWYGGFSGAMLYTGGDLDPSGGTGGGGGQRGTSDGLGRYSGGGGGGPGSYYTSHPWFMPDPPGPAFPLSPRWWGLNDGELSITKWAPAVHHREFWAVGRIISGESAPAA